MPPVPDQPCDIDNLPLALPDDPGATEPGVVLERRCATAALVRVRTWEMFGRGSARLGQQKNGSSQEEGKTLLGRKCECWKTRVALKGISCSGRAQNAHLVLTIEIALFTKHMGS